MLDAVSLWAIARLHPNDKTLIAKTTQRLCETLKSEDPRARKAAARALAGLKPGVEILLPAMIKAFQGASDKTVHDALEALAAFGGAPVPELIDVLKLVQIGPKSPTTAAQTLPLLIRGLHAPEARLRRAAAAALKELGPAAKPAVAELKKALSDADPSVRDMAAKAIAAANSRAACAGQEGVCGVVDRAEAVGAR